MASVNVDTKAAFFRPFADSETLGHEGPAGDGDLLPTCPSLPFVAEAETPKAKGTAYWKNESEDRCYQEPAENPVEGDITDPVTGEEVLHEKPGQEQKPAMSYIALIAKAILTSPSKRLNLGSIYKYIEETFPYYKGRGQGWRNSVRHNLSLNECFIKAGRCEDGKGNYWSIHPSNLDDFSKGDFRQRRRCRRRGRSKELETKLAGPFPSCPFPVEPLALSSLYSPYTEQERRAYRLDEVLYRQYITNPFWRWYHGCRNPGAESDTGLVLPTAPGPGPQWQQSLMESASAPNFFKAADN
ncbi:forkhead box protein E3-like [Leucoraja erinacea]|uniref:forkhead box protein E3-like n=1 Tax=Leucoraja erinaceus TaxID=7782 RepID=UPI002456F2E4|nr:forkhead box protein E3-like [Leucoraja erinacea]